MEVTGFVQLGNGRKVYVVATALIRPAEFYTPAEAEVDITAVLDGNDHDSKEIPQAERDRYERDIEQAIAEKAFDLARERPCA